MKFGKHIQSQQVPGWSAYYLDYKFLKKIISSLAANRPASEAAALALGIRPTDNAVALPESTSRSPSIPPIVPSSGRDEAKGPDFQAHKAAFFFKLERELEKINAFYLEREAQLKLRLETLLSKRRAAALRGLPDADASEDDVQTNAEWNAVVEGFRLLERDLGKLQQFVEINATGFRKILKKYDKRSTSQTKELYLARQVDVQPVFNRQLITELSDAVAACLVDITDLNTCMKFENASANDIFAQQVMLQSIAQGTFHEFEMNLRKAVTNADKRQIEECVHTSEPLLQQLGGVTNVTRILWRIILETPPDLADLIFASLSSPFDFHFVDDINGRTGLQEASIAGNIRLVNLCLAQNVPVSQVDSYGRSALHYACMNDRGEVCSRLLEVDIVPDALDQDNYSPLIYAILKGSFSCVQKLLQTQKVTVHRDHEPFPLHLASQCGHVDIVRILLEYGAKSRPNTNGQFPIHLAAQAGHVHVCRLLLGQEGWDTPDKYHEWTPLFHAARYGHSQCIQALLEAGSRANVRDEQGLDASHYAAWYGHLNCLRLIMEAMPEGAGPSSVQMDSPGQPPGAMNDIDLIPSLSLPPPIMSHRIYGHNYLDKTHLVQITISGSWTGSQFHPGIKIHHNLMGPVFRDEYLLAPAPLKLVTSTKAAHSAPYTVSLPQQSEADVFSFKTASLSDASIEFSLYPNFGTKTIGRAIVLPSLIMNAESGHQYTVPILDNRLHVIGEVSFSVHVVTSFSGVTLAVGGEVETYWKSPSANLAPPNWHSGLGGGGGHSNVSSPASMLQSSTNSSQGTISSLRGDYLYIVVQMTKDLHPVVYASRLLPESAFDLRVGDVTLEQFEALALRQQRKPSFKTVREWQTGISTCMISLVNLLKTLPMQLGLHLELACEAHGAGKTTCLNTFVDRTLHAVFAGSASSRRRTVFTSFNQDVCSSINWKQPNYPVFFASHCGRATAPVGSIPPHGGERSTDRRCISIDAAVAFAKGNNLLGILVDAGLLVQVPSLAQSIRAEGLLISAWGVDETSPLVLDGRTPGSPNEAHRKDALMIFADRLQDSL